MADRADTAIPLEEQLAAVEREVRMRERVYPRWIENGRMSPAKAAHEIAAMKSVLETVRKAAEGARLL